MSGGLRLIVCGGRKYDDIRAVWRALNELHRHHGIACIIHGGARGADQLAAEWAHKNNVETEPCPADWQTHGRSAGPRRNRHMLTRGPNFVLAFPGGAGTNDMIQAATKAGVPVLYSPPRTAVGTAKPENSILTNSRGGT